MKNIWVISLGGSRIVPEDVDYKFLSDFKKLLDSHMDKKFVVVCGGGQTARRYITALKNLGKKIREQSMEGIAVTRLHAGFMARIFGKEANEVVPVNMKSVRNLLMKNRVVFCGALRWRDNNTSDGNAAQLAGYLECPFINLTNVRGLYDRDPKLKNARRSAYPKLRSSGAKFISKISWKDFLKIARKISFEAGQHFVLDRIAKDKTVTYIVGSLGAMDSVLKGKRFVGTLISG